MTALALSRVHFPVTTLGPGRRIGVWFQGCSIRCPGCVSVDTWPPAEPTTDPDHLVAAIDPWLAEADGVTVTGGEPFDQPAALAALLRVLRPRLDGDILVYSGYPIEALAGRMAGLAGLIDALICDPFELETGDRLPLRGSDNQRLNLLTPLGRARLAGYDRPGGKSRAVDLMTGADGQLWLAGILRRGDLAALRRILEERGHMMLTTEHPAGGRRT